MKKKLSIFSIFLLGLNGIIGSGIFLLPAQNFQESQIYSILVMIIAGIMAIIISLNYAVMASVYSDDGGAWLYAYKELGRFAGFQVGWFGWWLTVITLSAEIVALLTTTKSIFPVLNNKLIFNLLAICILFILGVINLFGTNILKKINNITTIAKVVVLISFIIVSIFFMKLSNFNIENNLNTPIKFSQHISNSLLVIFYIFAGFNFLPIAAKRMEKPSKNLPKALIIIMITVTIIYTLVQIGVIGILGNSLKYSEIPLADAFFKLFGVEGKLFIIIGMIISILGVSIAVSFNAPIEIASLSKTNGLLPKILSKQNKHDSYWIANICTILMASILILSGGYVFLVKLIVIASFIQYVPTILSVIKLNNSNKLTNKNFKLPLKNLIPILALIIIFYLLLHQNITVLFWAIGIFILGIIVDIVNRKYISVK